MTRLLQKITAVLLILLFPAVTTAAEVFYVDTDAYGTPVVISDINGVKVWEATYLPFGEEHSTSTNTEPNNRRFIGKEKDNETGLTYFGARYYDDTLGIFTTIDPIGPVDIYSSATNYSYLANPQRLNRYAYGANNPYKYIDPDGREFLTITGTALALGVGGGIIGAGYNAYTNKSNLSGWKYTRSVGVGFLTGFAAGLSSVLGPLGMMGTSGVAAALNETHEQTLTQENLDVVSIGAAGVGGTLSAYSGKFVSMGFKWVGQRVSVTIGANLKPITGTAVEKINNQSVKTISGLGSPFSIPAGSAVQAKVQEKIEAQISE